MKLVSITKSNAKGKKWKAVFEDPKRTTHFGATGYEDYTQHGDDDRKNSYLARHKKNENWQNPTTAGSLSRWLLWNKKTFSDSLKDFKLRFNL
jgi:hypothetical protein